MFWSVSTLWLNFTWEMRLVVSSNLHYKWSYKNTTWKFSIIMVPSFQWQKPTWYESRGVKSICDLRIQNNQLKSWYRSPQSLWNNNKIAQDKVVEIDDLQEKHASWKRLKKLDQSYHLREFQIKKKTLSQRSLRGSIYQLL